MTETTDAEQELRDAETEAAEAQALVDELERRLTEGDRDVSAQELDEQHRRTRWARLRAEGAAKRHARAQAAAAVEAARQAIDQVASIETRDAELVDAWTAAVKALRTLVRVSGERSQAVRANAGLLASHDAKLQRVAGTNLAELGALPARYHGEQGYRIPDRGLDVADVPTSDLVAAAIAVGVDRATASAAGKNVAARAQDFPGSGPLASRIVGLRAAAERVIEEGQGK